MAVIKEPAVSSRHGKDNSAAECGDRQAFRSRKRICRPPEALGGDRLYNVAKLGFEWSLFIERRGRRGRPRLAAVSRDWQASQFVTGDSVSSQDLMPHRRPNVGSPADGGAHGPTHGSPSAGAGIVRSDKARSTASDGGLRPPCADSSAHEPAAERRRYPIIQSKDIKGGGVGR